MSYTDHKDTIIESNLAPLFIPDEGVTVIQSPGKGIGYWAGAPSIMYDAKDKTFYLYYRLRQPRGIGEDDRGFEVRIASSEDGIHFEDRWKLHKKELNSTSIERSYIVKVNDQLYRLYISYVDPVDNRWRIDLVEADSPISFDITKRQKVLTASDREGVEGVKDPYVVRKGDQYLMYFVYAQALPGSSADDMHNTGDVHNTGNAVAPTAVAVSDDGIHFEWLDTILPVGRNGWDRYQSRLTTIIPYNGSYTVLWDGSSGVEQNYEEKAALAQTFDLITCAKISHSGPKLETGLGKAVRYTDALIHKGQIWYYYEYTKEDGSHELRLYRRDL
jgi:predicted GH43/DUF377 family glycosyl hydrolase